MDNNFGWNLGGDFIAHYGTPRHSGRYPWGSGEKWRKIRVGVKNAGDKIKKFFGGKDRVDTSAVKGESSTQKLTSADSDENKAPITTAPKTETSSEPAKPDKKTALESGSREEILKVFQESSNEEIQRAINKAQLMDSLNKSIADAQPKQPETKSPEQMAKEERADYIKEALGSGDYNRIMEVATDKSVSNQDLQNALNKMNTIQSAHEKNSASAKFFENADRFKNAVDKTLGYYDTAANVWNTIALNYNNTANVKAGKSQPLGMLLTVPKNNQNQKNQQNQNNQQNNQQQVQQKQNQQQQQSPQKQQVQQNQNNQNQKQQKGEINVSNAVLQESIKKADTISNSTKQVQKEAEEKVKNKKLNEEEYANSLFPNWDGYGVRHSSLGNEIFEFVAHYGRGQISYC